MTLLANLPEDQFANALGLAHNLKTRAFRENKRKNLELLWQVLVGMWRDECRDYGLAEVGRRLARCGGPKTQSLRNEGGHDFRRLIEAFAVCAKANEPAGMAKGRSQLDLAVESLPDPAVRAMFRQIVAENKLYKSENDELRSAFKSISVRRPVDVAKPSSTTQVVTVPELTAMERDLLKRNLSPERFEENGWRNSNDGGVVDDMGVTILSPGFMETVAKLFP